MITVEMGKTKGGDVGQLHTCVRETLGQCVRSDANIDEQNAGRRPKNGRISSRTTGKNAELQRHQLGRCNKRVIQGSVSAGSGYRQVKCL